MQASNYMLSNNVKLFAFLRFQLLSEKNKLFLCVFFKKKHTKQTQFKLTFVSLHQNKLLFAKKISY